MLSSDRLKEVCAENNVSVQHLAGQIAHGGFSQKDALSAIRNWQKGLHKPKPKTEDVERVARALGVEVSDISQWQACCRYAPMSARKVRLVTQLIAGRNVQDALDILKFTHKRATEFVTKVLKSAIANADEKAADVESLYVSEARADDAGRRIGTKTWIAKDRGRAHPIHKHCCHVYVTVTEE